MKHPSAPQLLQQIIKAESDYLYYQNVLSQLKNIKLVKLALKFKLLK